MSSPPRPRTSARTPHRRGRNPKYASIKPDGGVVRSTKLGREGINSPLSRDKHALVFHAYLRRPRATMLDSVPLLSSSHKLHTCCWRSGSSCGMQVLFSTWYGFPSRMASTARSTFLTMDHVHTSPRSTSTITSNIGAPARWVWTCGFADRNFPRVRENIQLSLACLRPGLRNGTERSNPDSCL